MSSPSAVDKLADIHHVTLILRLALNRRGRLLHGELLDVELLDVAQTKPRRFKGWSGLTRALRDWLANQSSDDSATH